MKEHANPVQQCGSMMCFKLCGSEEEEISHFDTHTILVIMINSLSVLAFSRDLLTIGKIKNTTGLILLSGKHINDFRVMWLNFLQGQNVMYMKLLSVKALCNNTWPSAPKTASHFFSQETHRNICWHSSNTKDEKQHKQQSGGRGGLQYGTWRRREGS